MSPAKTVANVPLRSNGCRVSCGMAIGMMPGLPAFPWFFLRTFRRFPGTVFVFLLFLPCSFCFGFLLLLCLLYLLLAHIGIFVSLDIWAYCSEGELACRENDKLHIAGGVTLA